MPKLIGASLASVLIPRPSTQLTHLQTRSSNGKLARAFGFCETSDNMRSYFSSLFALTLGISTLCAQTPSAPTTPAPAPAAPAVMVPFSPQEQAFARTTSTYLQTLMQATLAGRGAKATDPDFSVFSTKVNRELVNQWTPFVNVCQAHKFNQIAIDVSKNTAEVTAKMSKLKGAEFRTEFFKLTKPEAQKALAYVQSFLPQIRNADLKTSADAIAAALKTTAESPDAKSKQPFTPKAPATKK